MINAFRFNHTTFGTGIIRLLYFGSTGTIRVYTVIDHFCPKGIKRNLIRCILIWENDFRHNAEPDVSLRYSAQGVESSSISIDRSHQSAANANPATADSQSAASRDQASANQAPTEDSGSSNPNQARAVSPNIILPGPRQITTHPGRPSTNPVTGQRQRRPGVSGPPSGMMALCTKGSYWEMIM